MLGKRLQHTRKTWETLASDSVSLSSDEEGAVDDSDVAGVGPPEAVGDRSMGLSTDEWVRRVFTR